jgi:transposase-like protein
VSTRAISRFLESDSPQSTSRLVPVMAEEVKRWRERLYAVFWDGTFLSVRRGTTAQEPGVRPDGRQEVLVFWVLGAEGESARNGEEVLSGIRSQVPGSRYRVPATGYPAPGT